jgi:hypothetical protein
MFILSPMGFGMFVEQHRYTLIGMGIIVVVTFLKHRGEGIQQTSAVMWLLAAVVIFLGIIADRS